MTGPLDGLLSRPSGMPWPAAPTALDVTAPATARNATALRRAFRRWVEVLVEEDAANDLTLAVYEALVNAVDHAFTAQRRTGSMRLHAAVADGRITITVTDTGTWRPPGLPTGQRGRGIPLIYRLATEAHHELSPQGTTVQLRHPLPLPT